MLDIPIPNNETVTVMVAQTTFAVLRMPGRSFRVDYLDKAEVCLKPGMRGEFMSYSEHPLLLSYNGRFVSVYINSRPTDSEKLFAEIQQRIEALFQGWRDWRCVLNGGKKFGSDLLRKNLLNGSGLLLPGAPTIVAGAVIDACKEYGASTYTDGYIAASLVRPLFHLLLVGDGYIIAKDFRFVQV
ncbi:MAG: hypothetical protein M3Y54_16855 [Bacteroidota bacterium]|nr:hypothetical protein [Bacteroidota bacterium]